VKLPVVAVVGRPNVGKSTFFNRVLGERLAIVEDRPGVTRDRNFARAEWAGRHFFVVDTGGMVEGSDEPMDRLIRQQVLTAIEEADVVVQLVDGKAGPHPLDYRIAEYLRRAKRPTILLVNKVDNLGDPTATAHHEFWDLGLGEPYPVSSLSGKGSGDVLDVIVDRLPAAGEGEEEEALRVAVIGKPNVGKSSLVNRLLGEDRLVVSEEAGTTRDAIDTRSATTAAADLRGHRGAAAAGAGPRERGVLQRAPDGAGDRARRRLPAADRRDRADPQPGPEDRAEGVGRRVRPDPGGQQVGPGGEGDDDRAALREGALREKAPFLEWVPILFTSATTGQRVQRRRST
jgi:GTPase